uniref:Conserved plasma membrane protein n=1 Tax=Haemonchus contortus TaxID=6289 RepID=A0A7I4Y2C5_HAECO
TMTGNNLAQPPKPNQRQVHVVEEGESEVFCGCGCQKQDCLQVAHLVSTIIHLIVAFLLLLYRPSYNDAQNGDLLIWQILLMVFYGVAICAKLSFLCSGHRNCTCLEASETCANIRIAIFAIIHTAIALVYEVHLEKWATSEIRSSARVWFPRSFYILSAFVNFFIFFGIASKRLCCGKRKAHR